jgi:hypothetical protein
MTTMPIAKVGKRLRKDMGDLAAVQGRQEVTELRITR